MAASTPATPVKEPGDSDSSYERFISATPRTGSATRARQPHATPQRLQTPPRRPSGAESKPLEIRGNRKEKIRRCTHNMKVLEPMVPRRPGSHVRAVVARVFFSIKREELERLAKHPRTLGRNHRKELLKKVGNMCGVGKKTVEGVVAEFLKTGAVATPDPLQATHPQPSTVTEVKGAREIVVLVRNFIREKHKLQEEVTGVTVTDYLLEQRLIHPNRTIRANTKEYQAVLRSVQRFLKNHGFTYGLSKAHVTETPQIVEARSEFLAAMNANRTAPMGQRYRFAFLDETYIHKHAHYVSRTLVHPDDPMPMQERRHKFNGCRHCIIGLILGPDLNVAEDKRDETQQARWFKPGYKIFESPTGKKRKRDYHTSFTAAMFEDWIKGVSAKLRDLGERVIFVMDNVKYHLAKQELALAREPGKQKLYDKCLELGLLPQREGGVPPVTKVYKHELRSWYRKWTDTLPTNVERIVHGDGHKVILTPPYHSELQPIEIVWANIKREFQSGYNVLNRSTWTAEHIKERFQECVDRLTPRQVAGCIRKAENAEERFRTTEDDAAADVSRRLFDDAGADEEYDDSEEHEYYDAQV